MLVWLIVNPRAGAGRAAKVAADALTLFRKAGIDPTVHICANGDEPARMATIARAEEADVVVAVGGDGLVAAVAQGLLGQGEPSNGSAPGHGTAPGYGTVRGHGDAPRSSTALAVAPTGSANDYARALGVRGLPIADQVALILDRAARAQVDVVRVETQAGRRHILNVGGTGFDAVVAERAMRITRLRGAPRYVGAMLAELPRFHSAQFTITLDGKPHETRAMMVAVANGTTYGGGMRVAPSAHLQNGWLDVCVIGELPRIDFLRAFPSVFRGTHIGNPAVTMLRAREVGISSDRRFGILGDGELLGTLPATFRVLPRALTVVVAPGAKMA